MDVSIDVDVQSNLQEILNEFNSKKEMCLEAMGLKGEELAKGYAPVGTPESTGKKGYIGGTLRNSISHTYDNDSAYIGTNVEYAPYQELGTYKMTAANGGKGFLQPAISEHVSEYQNIIETTMKG